MSYGCCQDIVATPVDIVATPVDIVASPIDTVATLRSRIQALEGQVADRDKLISDLRLENSLDIDIGGYAMELDNDFLEQFDFAKIVGDGWPT